MRVKGSLVKISNKADYALRAAVGLADAPFGTWTKADVLAQRTRIPREFLENILRELRHAGLVVARRGSEGGYALARDPEEIAAHEVLAAVGGVLEGPGASDGAVGALWERLSATSRSVLDSVTLAQLADEPVSG